MARPVVGTRLAGRYQVRALATGSAGHLFRGFDEQIGVEVALRIIDEDLLRDDADRRAFVQKATRVRPLQHPNLIRLYDILVDDTSVFLVMQWAPGVRLSQRLANGPPVDPAEARSILRRIAAGIAHAHQHGVVTGNLRADTVIVYPDGLKLTNVGIVPALPRDGFLSAMSARGALADLAPELRAGAELDARADVFALSRLAQRLFDPPGVPEAAQAVLQRGLAEEVALRPRDIEAFVRELEAALEGRLLERTPAVPTGYDTERVERLPPLPTEGEGAARPDAEVLVADRTQDATVSGSKGSRVLQLSMEDLVEVEAPSTSAALPTLQPRLDSDVGDYDATRRHEKLEVGGAIEVPSGEAERIPTLEATELPRQWFAGMPLVLAVAVLVGAAITAAALAVSHRSQQPVVVEARAQRTAVPVAQVPQVEAIPAPVVTKVSAVTTSGPCPLGMTVLPGKRRACIDLYEYPGGHTIPRTQVSFRDAAAVCESRGLRLCTDPEWEEACRGPQLASFPYGSSYDPSRCNTGGKATVGVVRPAGELARCRSASGAYDMSGNVAEWTSSGAQRGGSAMRPPPDGRCSHAVRTADTKGQADVGFRCCGDARL